MIPGFFSSELSGTKLSKRETIPIIGIFSHKFTRGQEKRKIQVRISLFSSNISQELLFFT